MKMNKIFRKSALQSDNSSNPIIEEGKEVLEKNGFSEGDIEYFADRMISVLDDYAEHFGEGTEVEYAIRKRLGRLEAAVYIPGEKYDPFENGDDSRRRKLEKTLTLNLNSQVSCIDHAYLMGRNVVSGSVPLSSKHKTILKDPVFWAVIMGVIVGLICLKLPENANKFVIDDVLNPVYKVILNVLSGVMGPVIFISLVTSIIALDSVNDLTNMGFKIFRRFLRVILFFVLISIAVSMVFFATFGPGGVDFSPNQIVSMLIGIIPVNIISPFLENNTPQLVVLAFVSGLALLLLGDRTEELCNILHQCNDWIMNIMKIVNKLLPIVPFFSIAIAIGQGNAGIFKEGWKFIAASYIIFTVCLIFKAIKLKLVTKISPIKVLKKAKPAIVTGFTTSSTSAPLAQIYEISDKELHIRREFSSFWVPMCTAMLALKTTVNVVVATMMMTEIFGMPISLSFLFVLVILTTEMSLASPGTVGSWVIAFEAFSMPTDSVGLFAAYRIFTINYSTAAVIAYSFLEEVEAAYKMGAVEAEKI